MVVARQVGHVADDVVVVHAGAVAVGRGRGLGDDVDADELADAQLREPLAHHAVAGAEIEDAEPLERHALGEQVDDDLGGRAPQLVVEELLVEAGDIKWHSIQRSRRPTDAPG
jgi:hypothetical protein